LDEEPDDVVVLSIIGHIYIAAKRWGMANVFCRRALELDPSLTQLYNNVGLTYVQLPGKEQEASHYLRKALKLDPKNAPAMSNMATLTMRECKPQECIQWANKALAIEPHLVPAKEDRGYANLMLRNWAEGWAGYEEMVGGARGGFRDELYWDGSKGKRLLVCGEQGIGDELSFASILPDAMRDNEIALECDPRLYGLLHRSFPDLEIHGCRFDREPEWRRYREFDARCLIGTLAMHYRKRDEDFPGTPFLVADPERRQQWKVLLDALPGKKIGIAWTGGLLGTFKHRRSVALESLLPILKTPGVSWISLQYKDASAEIAALKAKHGIDVHHWARCTEAKDYDETAALVAELDMVICVTTAAVDLAGGLGVPCWVLVPSKPHWRYGLTGDDKVWYRSVKLYRQKKEWKDTIERLAFDLAEHLHRR
jgi:tetratricopeptide (TPR) repeat protein